MIELKDKSTQEITNVIIKELDNLRNGLFNSKCNDRERKERIIRTLLECTKNIKKVKVVRRRPIRLTLFTIPTECKFHKDGIASYRFGSTLFFYNIDIELENFSEEHIIRIETNSLNESSFEEKRKCALYLLEDLLFEEPIDIYVNNELILNGYVNK